MNIGPTIGVYMYILNYEGSGFTSEWMGQNATTVALQRLFQKNTMQTCLVPVANISRSRVQQLDSKMVVCSAAAKHSHTCFAATASKECYADLLCSVSWHNATRDSVA